MKRTIGLFLIFTIYSLLSCEDEKITTSPETLTASQGTYVGVIRLAFSEAYGYGEMNFEIERFNENNATWENIAWIKTRHWDDHDQLQLLPNGIVPGKEYRYRMRAHTSDGGFGEYTPEVTGYAFKAEPVDIEDIVVETDDFDSKHVSVFYRERNDLSQIMNLESIEYHIFGYYSDFNKYEFSVKRLYSHAFPKVNDVLLTESWDHHEGTGKYGVEAVYRYYYDWGDRHYGQYEVGGAIGDGGNGSVGNGDHEVEFGDGVTDSEGNEYETVIIGEQEWMAENLRVTSFNDGTPVDENHDAWIALEVPVYTWYENDDTHSEPYGALYNWYVVETGNICPQGWRVPADADWADLADYLGGSGVAGGKLKSTQLWDAPNEGATNETGFTALPGGHRHSSGAFYDLGNSGRWWSSDVSEDPNEPNLIKGRLMHAYSTALSAVNFEKAEGLSVRCIKE